MNAPDPDPKLLGRLEAALDEAPLAPWLGFRSRDALARAFDRVGMHLHPDDANVIDAVLGPESPNPNRKHTP